MKAGDLAQQLADLISAMLAYIEHHDSDAAGTFRSALIELRDRIRRHLDN